MMKIRNKINGGTVEVGDDYAERLIASGEYEKAEKPARATRKTEDKKKEA